MGAAAQDFGGCHPCPPPTTSVFHPRRDHSPLPRSTCTTAASARPLRPRRRKSTDGEVGAAAESAFARRTRALPGSAEFASANVGILTGLSGITIIDCDDADLLEHAFSLFGETRLVTETPSGGHHAWYRANGERCLNLRPHGVPIDIKGLGGFVVVPPSVRPEGKHAGRPYRFVRGGLDDLPTLPSLRPDALTAFQTQRSKSAVEPTTRQPIPEGTRNERLFKRALRLAASHEAYDALHAALLALNDVECSPPLEPGEVAKIARSAWRYRIEGRNWVTNPQFTMSNDRLAAISDPNAFFLLAHLWRLHGNRNEHFALVPEAMRAHRVIPGMSAKAIAKARDRLLVDGYLVRTHKGGRGPGDPSRFRLGTDPRLGLPD